MSVYPSFSTRGNQTIIMLIQSPNFTGHATSQKGDVDAAASLSLRLLRKLTRLLFCSSSLIFGHFRNVYLRFYLEKSIINFLKIFKMLFKNGKERLRKSPTNALLGSFHCCVC